MMFAYLTLAVVILYYSISISILLYNLCAVPYSFYRVGKWCCSSVKKFYKKFIAKKVDCREVSHTDDISLYTPILIPRDFEEDF